MLMCFCFCFGRRSALYNIVSLCMLFLLLSLNATYIYVRYSFFAISFVLAYFTLFVIMYAHPLMPKKWMNLYLAACLYILSFVPLVPSWLLNSSIYVISGKLSLFWIFGFWYHTFFLDYDFYICLFSSIFTSMCSVQWWKTTYSRVAAWFFPLSIYASTPTLYAINFFLLRNLHHHHHLLLLLLLIYVLMLILKNHCLSHDEYLKAMRSEGFFFFSRLHMVTSMGLVCLPINDFQVENGCQFMWNIFSAIVCLLGRKLMALEL